MSSTLQTEHVRDHQLDVYRALMMIYVPCVIHVLYWLQKGNSVINSLLLFEMPVIFYISGATMYITGKKRSMRGTITNRVTRVLLPYYFYILCGLIIISLFAAFFPEHKFHGSYSVSRMVFAQDDAFPLPYVKHLWFIVPYLLVSCSFGIQQKWADKLNRWVYLLILVLLFALSAQILPYKGIAVPFLEALFYNIFFMAGYLFYRRISLKALLYVTGTASVAVAIICIQEWREYGFLSMQDHKFPPDLVFLTFGICSIGILALVFRNFQVPAGKVLRHWNKYGYSIYLWQNFSFLIYSMIYRKYGLEFLAEYPVVDYIVAAAVIFIISSLTSFVIAPVEKLFLRQILRKRK